MKRIIYIRLLNTVYLINLLEKKAYKTHNPYGIGNTGTKIASFLANLKLDKKLLQKKMTIKGIKKIIGTNNSI